MDKENLNSLVVIDTQAIAQMVKDKDMENISMQMEMSAKVYGLMTNRYEILIKNINVQNNNEYFALLFFIDVNSKKHSIQD